MTYKKILMYAFRHKLYDEVVLTELANECRMKTGDIPLIVVDGRQIVWYLYQNCDFYCGGQYKEFRAACKNFVRRFRNCGVHLAFFFYGLPPADMEKWVRLNRESTGNVGQSLRNVHVQRSRREGRLPEGLVPCARVIFREEMASEVHLSTGDCLREAAQYAASQKNCLGVLSRNVFFLLYNGVPSLLLLPHEPFSRNGVTLKRIRSADIASHLGIEVKDIPAFAIFREDGLFGTEQLKHIHGRLVNYYNCRRNLDAAIAKMVKGNTVEEMCQIAFGDRRRDFLETVEAEIGKYVCNATISDVPLEASKWCELLQFIETKHMSGEIPGMVLSLAKCRTFRVGPALEDLSDGSGSAMSTAEVLQPMRRRMYTVLLWESGDGPFLVDEYFSNRSGISQAQVEVQKSLRPGVSHPGLRRLWTGALEQRWQLFSWVVGAPHPGSSSLRALRPQYLAVPAAALNFLRNEAHILERHEVEVLAMVATIVESLPTQQLAQIEVPQLDDHAIYLATLFVRTALHVLDAAAICGLSFPRESDCLLDAYFDGKLFHKLYISAKAQSFASIPTQQLGVFASYSPHQQLFDVIEGTHSNSQ